MVVLHMFYMKDVVVTLILLAHCHVIIWQEVVILALAQIRKEK